MTPTAERFRRLARSSPERWHEVSFDLAWALHDVRVTVRRPDRVRVVAPDSRLLFDGAQEPTRRGPRPAPSFDEDGLVTTLRRADLEDDTVPMWQSYRFVALLDPAELADGLDGRPGVEVLELAEVAHAGRPAWEARVRPTEDYAPLCTCCALLRCEVADRYEGRPVGEYPDHHLVRLDVATGLCVLSAEVGGPRDGEGHDVQLREVRMGPGRSGPAA